MSTPPAPPEAPAPDLEEKVAFLRSPAAWPDAPGRAAVEARETHMSWVFLVGDFVWKLKKPVRHPPLDYSTLARRRACCEAELRLNRRLAPGVYLDVRPLNREADGRLRVGGAGDVVDWLVLMRRLPTGRMLDAALEQGTATCPEVARAAALLAASYARAAPETVPEAEYLDRFTREIAANREMLSDSAFGLPPAAVGSVLETQEVFLGGEGGRAALLGRLRGGRVVEGHGDLRPEHVYLGEPPAVIDCLEFDRTLRLLDPFEELAFLKLECELIPGGGWAGRVFLQRCAATLGDTPPPAPLLAFYTAFRASLRARLCLAHLRELQPREPAKWVPKARRYLAVAEAACAGLRLPPSAAR